MAKIKENPKAFKVNKPGNADTAFVRNGETSPAFIYRETNGIYNYVAEFGRAHGTMDCPWCETSNKVYIWSLSGGGKRCENCKCMLGNRMATVSVEAYQIFKIRMEWITT